MRDRPPTIFMSAAEASGDEHAAKLITAIRRRLPGAKFMGVAGPKMVAAGCESLLNLTQHASMIGGPFLRAGWYFHQIRKMQKAIRRIRPDIHIPVDSPALNWHLAAAARKVGSLVCYYIAPQVWAWAPWRIKKVRRLTDHVLCILPFEEEYFRARGVTATYIGHPLFDHMPDPPQPRPDLLDAWAHGHWRVALLPGSRGGEQKSHTRALLACARAIGRRWPDAECVFSVHDDASAAGVRKYAGEEMPCDIRVGGTREILAESHFAVATSGTVTLETAWFGVPMVVFYRTGRLLGCLHKMVGRWGVPTPYFSLVNILAGRGVVPELIPWHGNVRRLTKTVMEVMEEPGCLLETRDALTKITAPLRVASGTASDRAADVVVEMMMRRPGLKLQQP